MQQIYILGYSEAMIAMLLETLRCTNSQWRVKIIQNMPPEEKYPFLPEGMEIDIQEAAEWRPETEPGLLLLGVGTVSAKEKLFAAFEQSHGIARNDFMNLVHPSAVVASSVKTKTGIYCEPASVLSPFASIGFGVTVNRGVTIGHHSIIGDFTSINPGVHIAGHCEIGPGVRLGIGSVVFDRVSIGAGSVVGGGSVVTKNIPPGVMAWGNPCKIIRAIDHA